MKRNPTHLGIGREIAALAVSARTLTGCTRTGADPAPSSAAACGDQVAKTQTAVTVSSR